MRAIAVMPTRKIAIMAKDSESWRKSILAKPNVKLHTAASIVEFSPMFVPATVDVVNGHELFVGYVTASTLPAIAGNHFGAKGISPAATARHIRFAVLDPILRLRKSEPVLFSHDVAAIVGSDFLAILFSVASAILKLLFGKGHESLSLGNYRLSREAI